MNAVTIPQAVKRVIGRCMAAAPLVAVFALYAAATSLAFALLVWGVVAAIFGLFWFGMKWGFDE